jgi:FKBP-type peptidyl-prolyl cis-trans isomerase (trigger factor)
MVKVKIKELRNIANSLVKSEEDAEKFKEEKETHEKAAQEAAEKHLKQFFIFRKIADKEGIEVENAEIEQSINSMSSMYGMKAKELMNLMQKNGGMEDLHIDMLMGKVSGFLLENATTEETKKPAKKKATKKKKTEEEN